ncbi:MULTISPECIES: GrpB family protein [unclassified Aeromicrobium]|uniref:GrpB family protein n=1 Tax=unclassified Aeromicrobium TaxID=2633570 RepID=UPI00396AFC95
MGALGPAVEVEHVGSTSVPGLPAKPIVDVDVIVPDPEDEAAYVPALQAVGLVLAVREPWWQGAPTAAERGPPGQRARLRAGGDRAGPAPRLP